MSEDYQSFFQVRLANYDDIPDIMEITREAFTKYGEMADCDPNRLEALKETAEDIRRDIDTKLVLLAVQDGIPLGSARVEIFPDHTAYLSRFGVRLNNQNNGIGKNIINLVDRIMIKKGIKRISLHTGSKITSLIRFYYGRGFYIESTDTGRGYLRALLVKDYE
jgi:ribosomal protein S18 acetylase RimI-like enzyme